MNNLIYPLISAGFASAYICPDNTEVANVALEYLHIQDFSTSYQSLGNKMKTKLAEAFQKVSDAFDGDATFSVVRAIDKNLTRGDYPCNDNMHSFRPAGHADLLADLDVFGKSSSYIGNYSRPSLFDAAIWQMNEYVTSDPYDPITGNKVIRVISLGADQCIREQGYYESHTSEWIAGIEADRKIYFPLDGTILASCHDHDYLAPIEVAKEAFRNDTRFIFLISPEGNKETTICQDYPNYPGDDYAQMTIGDWWRLTQSTFEEEFAYATLRLDVDSALDNLADIILDSVSDLMCSVTTVPPPTTTAEPTTAPPLGTTPEPPLITDDFTTTEEKDNKAGIIAGSVIGALLAIALLTVLALMAMGIIPGCGACFGGGAAGGGGAGEADLEEGMVEEEGDEGAKTSISL